ncbi:MAG: Target of rapamycin complex 2 subunit avo2 [Ramalina farinacea]|uniref:Target of rapamycin complex 2 subunit avo2 n=1 Tax=Ramalina farinacea TaxID=258253 RepID=A0AA43QGY0_9LECA|nr:Target of rapamycin complex 2 subunit avo2 [Ramalina farinacea]
MSNLNPMIDPPTRVRRAIHLNDLPLLQRIIKNNPNNLRNPDIRDHGNTSLHLAAKLGRLEIAIYGSKGIALIDQLKEYLITAGHEEHEGISRNADKDTPLHVAVAAGHEQVALLLAGRFPSCIPWKNREGEDVSHFFARSQHH